MCMVSSLIHRHPGILLLLYYFTLSNILNIKMHLSCSKSGNVQTGPVTEEVFLIVLGCPLKTGLRLTDLRSKHSTFPVLLWKQ